MTNECGCPYGNCDCDPPPPLAERAVKRKRRGPLRAGDKVRIAVPTFVTRVGYPKQPDDYLAKVKAHRKWLLEYFHTFDIREEHPKLGPITRQVTPQDRILDKIEREVAYALAKTDGFGGPERMLHTVEYPLHLGKECYISSVRTAVTGTYYRGRTTYDGWNGDYDYEPGGIENRKSHRIAKVTLSAPNVFCCTDNFLEIELHNLERAT